MNREFDDMLRRRINASPVKAELLELGFARGAVFTRLEARYLSENPDKEIPQEVRIAVDSLDLDTMLAIKSVIDAAKKSYPLTFSAMWKLITEALSVEW